MKGLPGYGLFAAMLAAAGLPIYLHAPSFYASEYGLSLTALAAILFWLRLVDVVQDPVFGWVSARLHAVRGVAVSGAIAVLGVAMFGLFAVRPPVAPLLWFAMMLTALFSAYSFLTITFYARGVAKASELGEAGHFRLASWRETGALIGVCLAAVAPGLLIGLSAPMAGFAFGFAALCLLGWLGMRADWGGADGGQSTASVAQFRSILADPVSRRLLIVGLANAAPVAVSASLFFFFVEDVLQAALWAGPLLLVFFVTAALGAVIWPRVAHRIGARKALSLAMVINIFVFAPVPLLGVGDAQIFAVICLISGFCVGADVTLLPALFARRLETRAASAPAGFGLWSFVNKFTLALAAIVLLPALEAAGFQAGGDSPKAALQLLAIMYAGLPCGLKVVALGVLWMGPMTEVEHA